MLALLDCNLLDLGGTYGNPEAGDPIQYDELRIEHDQGEVEIVVYDRAILLFTDDCEAVRRIHQVCAAGAGTEVRCRTIARSGFAPSHGGVWSSHLEFAHEGIAPIKAPLRPEVDGISLI